MHNNIKFRSIFLVAKTEFTRLVKNPRIIVVGMLLAIIKGIVIDPLIDRSVRFGGNYNFCEPFIAVCSCTTILLFIPAVFIILVSDFPDINSNTLFQIQRCGRINFLLGQILAAVFVAVVFIVFIFFSCGIMMSGHIEFSTEWSDVATKFNVKFPKERNNLVSQLLTSSLYNQSEFVPAFVNTFIFMLLFMVMTALIILTFRILYLKTAGIFCAYFVAAMGFITLLADNKSKWIFPTAHLLVSEHYNEIFRQPIMPLWATFMYFFGIIILLVTADIFIIKKMNINTMGE